MNFFSNDTNPYAPPVPVEEDAASYDLLKIARLYNRLVSIFNWGFLLLCIAVLPPMCAILAVFFFRSFSPTILDIIFSISMCLSFFSFIGLIFLWLYGVFVISQIAFAMKYSALARLLIVLGALPPCGIIGFYVLFWMCRKAEAILRDGGIEITGGKVDLAKIPVEYDY